MIVAIVSGEFVLGELPPVTQWMSFDPKPLMRSGDARTTTRFVLTHLANEFFELLGTVLGGTFGDT